MDDIGLVLGITLCYRVLVFVISPSAQLANWRAGAQNLRGSLWPIKDGQ
jgi:hypothetical protein